MPEFRTRPDGTVYPLTPKKGGGLLGVALLALLLFGAGGKIGIVGPNADETNGIVDAAKAEAKAGHVASAWAKLGWQFLGHISGHNPECAGSTFGHVRDFFLQSPCRSLDRSIQIVRETRGSTIAITIAWVHMPSIAAAQQFQAVIDTDGSGDILPLATTVAGTSGYHFDGHHYKSRIDGSTVIVAESAIAQGSLDTATLNSAAIIGANFPGP